ncbi:MAG: hypothetical protein IPP51_03900 [Bacteroidetes bacterium]|nr:hypothetical protein [Bacteroidota bacterium]
MTINKTANASAKGLIFKTGSSTTGTTNCIFAAANYGTGKVCGLGDSSLLTMEQAIRMTYSTLLTKQQ